MEALGCQKYFRGQMLGEVLGAPSTVVYLYGYELLTKSFKIEIRTIFLPLHMIKDYMNLSYI